MGYGELEAGTGKEVRCSGGEEVRCCFDCSDDFDEDGNGHHIDSSSDLLFHKDFVSQEDFGLDKIVVSQDNLLFHEDVFSQEDLDFHNQGVNIRRL